MDAETPSADPAWFLQRVQVEWAALEYVISGLSDAELTRPGPDGWSIKDHLAHVGEWDAELAAVLRGREPHEGFRLPTKFEGDIDGLNEVLYQRHRSESMDDVQAEARRAHADLIAALSHVSAADLDARLRQKITEDSYGHYADHTGWIKALLA